MSIETGSASAPNAQAARKARRGYTFTVMSRLRYDYVTLVLSAVVILIVLGAIFAPIVWPVDPQATSMLARLKPIGTSGHPLGTDELGRDMLARLLYGGRTSLITGIVPVIIAVVAGGGLGVVAGFVGGTTNMGIMRVMDVFYAFPSVLLAIAISGTMGGGMASSLIALSVVFIPAICRVAETTTTQIRSLDYIEAARASGAPAFKIVAHHVLGNVFPPVLIYAASMVSMSILMSAGLSFLGLGVAPPTPDWGAMLSNLRQAIYIQPLVCALPGVMIFIVSLAFNMISDGLRQAMDVKA